MKSWLYKNRIFILFMICLGFFRTSIADWNPIPSGSMRPTLLEGDVVLVDRVAYDFKLPLSRVPLVHLGDPERGDIITFYSPKDDMRLIKRVIGLPGDQVMLRDEVLFVNGVEAEYTQESLLMEPIENAPSTHAIRLTERIDGSERHVQWLPEVPARRDFGPVQVPQDSYLVLGDNRDNSADSRYIGFVQRDILIGRAHHVLVSADIKGNWLPRFERFGSTLQ